jgi:hypothetical protein
MESDEPNQDLERKITVENLNIEILPVIYEIIRRFVDNSNLT